MLAYDAFLDANKDHWLAREIRLYWKRVLKRVDLTSRSLVALIEPGSCFAGTLAELVFAADRSYMLIGQLDGDNRPPATLALGRRQFRRLSDVERAVAAREPLPRRAGRRSTRRRAAIGKPLDAEAAEKLGLVTFALDDIDWDDEIRVFLEERASFSPDGLTGLEANLRFGGPETMESKIFARLTAWQNWIFQRPNAVGEEGALQALRHRPEAGVRYEKSVSRAVAQAHTSVSRASAASALARAERDRDQRNSRSASLEWAAVVLRRPGSRLSLARAARPGHEM